jgi:hypothetical protein
MGVAVGMVFATLVVVVWSVDRVGKKEEEKLTERQVQILEEKGLSTNYNELTGTQKIAIKNIEEMLEYAEEKYGEEFAYKYYTGASLLDSNIRLDAYPVDGNPDTDTFEITLCDGEMTDDYMGILIRDALYNYLVDGLRSCLPEEVAYDDNVFYMRVYDIDTRLTVEDLPIKRTVLDGNVGFGMLLFLDDSILEYTTFDEVKTAYEQWCADHLLFNSTRILCYADDVVSELNYYNDCDYFFSESKLEDEQFWLNRNGYWD